MIAGTAGDRGAAVAVTGTAEAVGTAKVGVEDEAVTFGPAAASAKVAAVTVEEMAKDVAAEGTAAAVQRRWW